MECRELGILVRPLRFGRQCPTHLTLFLSRGLITLTALVPGPVAAMRSDSKTIIIVGGGFAGIYAARHLRRHLPTGWRIILFSRENHFIFTPLLGDVVGSSINP